MYNEAFNTNKKKFLTLYLNLILSEKYPVMVFINILKSSKEAVSSLFTRNKNYHDYYTRVNRSLNVPVGKTASISKTFRFCAIKIWNYIVTNVTTMFRANYNYAIDINKSYVI